MRRLSTTECTYLPTYLQLQILMALLRDGLREPQVQ